MTRLIFYDGDCGLCSAVVRYLIRVDRARVFRYAPIASELYAALVHHPAMDSVVYAEIANGGAVRVWYFSDAVIQIGDALGGVHRVGGKVLALMPRALRDAGYRLVARHRKQIAGAACLVPTPETRLLFVERLADVNGDVSA